MDKITHVIVVTNTWTKKQWIHPGPFYGIEKAESALKQMVEKCSSTGSTKNNEFEIIPVQGQVVAKQRQYKVWKSYKFPNGMIVTYDFEGEQIPDLQGPATEELEQKIKENSGPLTELQGFYL